MSDSDQNARSLTESIRGIARSLGGLLQTRVELFGVELQEEKIRALRLMAWFAAAIALSAAGLMVAMGALAIFLWRVAGYGGLIGLALVGLAAGAGILWWVRWQLVNGPAPFAQTAAEFGKDAENFRELS